ECRKADFTFQCRGDHEGADIHADFAEFDGHVFRSETVVARRHKAHATTYRFALGSTDDDFGRLPDGVDDLCESGKKSLARFFVGQRQELIETCSGTEATLALTLQEDQLYGRFGRGLDVFAQLLQ